jgi:hypothetical protein
MKNVCVLLIIILSTTIFSYSQAGTIDPSVSDASYVTYGQKFKCVVHICGQTFDKKTYCASAVVIKKNWIITAAHVVESCEKVKVVVEDKEYCVDQMFIHKDFNDNQFGTADIALGYIKEDINLDFYPELYTENNEVGKICCISGFGITGTFNTGSVKSDHLRRAGSNYIDKIDRDLLICTPSFKGSTRHTVLEFIISHGDSGGGLFIDKKLAGINSCVIAEDKNPNSNYGDEAGHTRVSKFSSWINEVISSIEKPKTPVETNSFSKTKQITTANELSNTNHINIIIYISCLINVVCIAIGYCLGKLQNYHRVSEDNNYVVHNRKNVKQHSSTSQTPISIDSSKVVVDINTEGLEKKYNKLGDIKKSQDNISNSINKLKNMKG